MKMFRVVVNNNEYQVEIEELAGQGSATPAPPPQAAKPAPTPAPPSPAPAAPQKSAKPAGNETAGKNGNLVAPMPGTVLSVAVNVGDKVTKGQTVLILEAMKMENEIMAPADGTVEALNVSQGVSVNAGEILVVLS